MFTKYKIALLTLLERVAILDGDGCCGGRCCCRSRSIRRIGRPTYAADAPGAGHRWHTVRRRWWQSAKWSTGAAGVRRPGRGPRPCWLAIENAKFVHGGVHCVCRLLCMAAVVVVVTVTVLLLLLRRQITQHSVDGGDLQGKLGGD